MKNKVTILCALVCAFVSLGLKSVTLADIEIALLDKDFGKSEQLSRHFIQNHPNTPRTEQARYYLGLSQMYQKQYESARKTFRTVVNAAEKKDIGYKASLGIVDSFIFDGHYKEAVDYTKRILKKVRNSEYASMLYLKAARASINSAHWTAARKYLNKIIQDYPDSIEYERARQMLEEEQFFTVQIGSFQARDKAEELVLELKQKGLYAYIVETVGHNHATYYRVRVGQLSQLGEAKKLRKKLSSLGYPTSIYP